MSGATFIRKARTRDMWDHCATAKPPYNRKFQSKYKGVNCASGQFNALDVVGTTV